MTLALAVFLLLLSSSAVPVLPDRPVAQGDCAGCDASIMAIDAIEFKAKPSTVYVNETVTFYANASSSIPGATLTFTIFYDFLLADGTTQNPESPVSVNTNMTPGNVVTTYAYDHVGNLSSFGNTYFIVRLSVSDGSAVSNKTIPVYVVGNSAPVFVSKPSTLLNPDNDVPLNISYKVQDVDDDPLAVTWDFGDGSPLLVHDTAPAGDGVYVNETHTWSVPLEPGRGDYFVYFFMNVSFEDEFGHVLWSNHTIEIWVPYNLEPKFSLTASTLYSSPGDEVVFRANATDPEGDPITWMFVFNNSVEDYLTEVHHTDPTEANTTVWMNVSHVFEEIGNYTVALYISDALPPYQTGYHNLSTSLGIRVSFNRAPYVLANISMTPVEPRINATTGHVSVQFSIQANDPDGDVLHLAWRFGDGNESTNVSGGGTRVYTFYQVHNYTVAGYYNVSVVVDDGHGHSILRYKVILVLTDNRAPRLVRLNVSLSEGTYSLPNEPLVVRITVSDAELDPITIWVDFGDNTTLLRVDLTEFTEDKTVSWFTTYSYNRTGTFNFRISFTDNMYGPTHNVTITLPIEVKSASASTVRIWDWWDYTSILLIFVGFGLIFARWLYLGRFRKRLDSRGMTLDEYEVIVKEMKELRKERIKELKARVEGGAVTREAANAEIKELKESHRKKLKELREAKPEPVREALAEGAQR